MLRLVPRAISLRPSLLHTKVDRYPLEFGTRVVDTKDLQNGWTANLVVSHVAARNGFLEALPFGVGVVSGEWSKGISACPIHQGCCHVVPNYTTPALYRTNEPVFLRSAASASPYISLAIEVFSPEVPTPDLESDEYLQDRDLWLVRGVGQYQGFEDLVPCVKRLLEWEIQGNANLATLCYGLQVTFRHCGRLSCCLCQNEGTVDVSKFEVLTSC